MRVLLVIAVLFLPALSESLERFHASLTYVRKAGAEACPDEAALRRSVAARLGYEPWSDTAARRLSVEVSSEDGGWSAAIALTDETGEVKGRRDLTSVATDCRDLAESLALALGLALDPLLLTRPPPEPLPEVMVVVEPAPEPPPPPELPPEAPPPPPPPPPLPEAPPAPEPRSPVLLGIEVEGAWVRGLEPAPSWGGGGAVTMRVSRFLLAARLRADLPQSMEVPEGNVRGAGIVARLEPCLWVRPWAVCLTGGVARLRFTSDRRSDAMDAHRTVGVVGPRVSWNLGLGERFGVFAAAQATLLTGAVVLRDAGERRPWWSTGAFDVSFSAGLSWRLVSL